MPYPGNLCYYPLSGGRGIGQVPGATYSGQVVDSTGRGLYAGWLFLDENGVQIMEDKYTDQNGFFHYTVPMQNHENIFIQFYATNDFEPLVLSFAELVNLEKVVLMAKQQIDKTPWLIGAGIGLLYLIGKRVKNFK